MTLTYDFRKYEAWLKKVQRATGGKPWVVEVYSTGWVGRDGDSLQETIEDQATWGRDPWFMSAHIQGTVSKTVLNSIVKPLNSGGHVDLRSALNEIGATMLKAAKANYRNARNKRGRFKPVSAKRLAIKERVGLDARPMFADGRLYNSLNYRIKV